MATVYFSRWIYVPDGGILENGGIVVENDRILSVGPRGKLRRSSKDRVVNLGETLLMPGLINMHTHLEQGILRGMQKADDEPFAAWLARSGSALKAAPADTLLSSIRLCIREALANGITTIVDTSATDFSALVLRDEPVRSWIFHEISGASPGEERLAVETLQKRIERCRHEENIGVAPYALFSVSPQCHKALIELARSRGYLWSCHMAESAEELQAFSAQTGELYASITLDRAWPFGKTERGSLYYAITQNLIPQHGICFHCNYMSSQELSLLSAKNVSVVFCAQHNATLGHKPFPLDVALGRGVNVCIGTESPASSMPMSLFDELFLLKNSCPHIPARKLLDLVTVNAAKALRYNQIGSLKEGFKADIIGVRFPHVAGEDILEEMIIEEARTVLVIVDGEEVIVGY